MPVAVLMPVYNEPELLGQTLRGVAAHADALGGVTVFLVDDGSEPKITVQDLPLPTPAFRLVLARHAVNLGQGAALETARQLALLAPPFVAYVTMDADGQHRIEDMLALVSAVLGGADVAFGNRFSGDSNVPAVRSALLRGARLFERAITGLSLSDAHNGYRAFSRRALLEVQIRQNRMAHATEIKQQISRANRGYGGRARLVGRSPHRETAEPLSVVEVPVSVRYSRRTLQKGQPSLGAFTVLRDLFYRYLFEESE